MNFKRISNIYLKEIKEIFRSPGLIFILIIFPAIIYPFILYYTGNTAFDEKTKIDSSDISICVKESKLIPNLSEFISPDDKITILKSDNHEKIDKDCKLIVVLEKQADLFQSGYPSINVNLLYDSTDRYSLKALDRLKKIFDDVKQESIYERFDDKNIPPEIITPISISQTNMASNQKITGNMVGNILPFIIIMFIMSGAMQIAIDITAGEKDRKTIQTLLISPAMRIDIIIAKLFVVISTAIMCGMINLCSMYAALYFMAISRKMSLGLTLDLQTFLLGIIVIVPLIIFLSSILTAIGISAKNQVEAGIYTMPLYTIGLFPLIAVSSVEITNISTSNFFIPIYNTALTIKLILMSSFTWESILITVLSNLIYSSLFIFICIKLFHNEEIIFSGIGETVCIFFKKLLESKKH